MESEGHRIAQREDLNFNMVMAEGPVSQSLGSFWGRDGPTELVCLQAKHPVFECALSQGHRINLDKEALFSQRQFFQIISAELSVANAPSSWGKDNLGLQEQSSIVLQHTS